MKNKQKYTKPYSLEPNVEAALAYLLTPFSGLAVYLFEKENKFVRFHAMQSILFGVAVIVASGLAGALVVILIGLLLAPLISIAAILLWVLLMWKAYNNEEWELPILGKIARDQIK